MAIQGRIGFAGDSTSNIFSIFLFGSDSGARELTKKLVLICKREGRIKGERLVFELVTRRLVWGQKWANSRVYENPPIP